jgi:hypothetical protein
LCKGLPELGKPTWSAKEVRCLTEIRPEASQIKQM